MKKIIKNKINKLVSTMVIFALIFTSFSCADFNRGKEKVYGSTVVVSSKTTNSKTAKGDVANNKDSVKINKKEVYIDQALGFTCKNPRRQLVKFFDKNWDDGIKYNGGHYCSIKTSGGDPGKNINYNFAKKKQYIGKEAASSGYGYNCTGVVTSVFYYASKTDKSWNKFYANLLNSHTGASINNGFSWWSFINKYNVKKYCAGIVSNPSDVNKVLNKAKDLKTGYMIYFEPYKNCHDCHLGFYWGKNKNGQHMMRHSIWSGLQWSAAFPGAPGTYKLYVMPVSGKQKTYTKTVTFKLKIKRKQVKNDKKKIMSLSGDKYNIYTKRKGKKLSGKLIKRIKTKNKNKKQSKKKKRKSSKKTKNVKKYRLPITLNRKGESYRTVKVKVKVKYKNGKIKKYWISKIGGVKVSKKRKFKQGFWIKEAFRSTPRGYEYNPQFYTVKVEKASKKKIKLSLYKGCSVKDNYIKSAKQNRTLRVYVK